MESELEKERRKRQLYEARAAKRGGGRSLFFGVAEEKMLCFFIFKMLKQRRCK